MMRKLLFALLFVCWSAIATEPAPTDRNAPAGPPAEADHGAAPSPPAVAASDQLQLDTTSIRGNRELPRVLTIVPWKDPALGELIGKPVNSLLDEALAPVDREVFRRQTAYFDQLYAEPE